MEATAIFLARAEYWISQRPGIVYSAEYDIQTALQYSSRLGRLLADNGHAEEGASIEKRVEDIYAEYLMKRQQMGD